MTRIRKARPGLVANQEQYRLVYSLVEEALVCGDNSRSLAQLKSSASKDLTEEFLLVNKVNLRRIPIKRKPLPTFPLVSF